MSKELATTKNTNIEEIDLEKALTLVSEIVLGKIVTNAKEIKAVAEKKVAEYNVDNYPYGHEQAKKDRATLNKSTKAINDKRIAIEKKWNEPLGKFKEIIAETTNLIDTASDKLDAIVKKKEQEERDEKRLEIEDIWKKRKFNLVELERVFNDRWLNKSYRIKTIEDDITGIIEKINNELVSLESFGEDTEQLKSLYLGHLDIASALNEGRRLKESRERLAEMERQKEEARKQAELAEQARKEAKEQQKQAESQEKVVVGAPANNKIFSKKEEAIGQKQEEPKQVETKASQEKTYQFVVVSNNDSEDLSEKLATIFQKEKFSLETKQTLSFVGSIEEINKFKEILEKNNLNYEKLPGIAVLSI